LCTTKKGNEIQLLAFALVLDTRPHYIWIEQIDVIPDLNVDKHRELALAMKCEMFHSIHTEYGGKEMRAATHKDNDTLSLLKNLGMIVTPLDFHNEEPANALLPDWIGLKLKMHDDIHEVYVPSLLPSEIESGESIIQRIVVKGLHQPQLLERPVFFVFNDDIHKSDKGNLQVFTEKYWVPNPNTWYYPAKQFFRSIGRIMFYDEISKCYQGLATGWLIQKDVLVTNRHVVTNELYEKNDPPLTILKLVPLKKVHVDFFQEFAEDATEIIPVTEVIHVSETFDIAFLRLASSSNRPVLQVANQNPEIHSKIMVVGFPGYTTEIGKDKDYNKKHFEIMRAIYGPDKKNYGLKRLSPGKVVALSLSKILYDASTLPGNSGSAVFNLQGKVGALHIGSFYRDNNCALSCEKIRELATLLGLKID